MLLYHLSLRSVTPWMLSDSVRRAGGWVIIWLACFCSISVVLECCVLWFDCSNKVFCYEYCSDCFIRVLKIFLLQYLLYCCCFTDNEKIPRNTPGPQWHMYYVFTARKQVDHMHVWVCLLHCFLQVQWIRSNVIKRCSVLYCNVTMGTIQS